MKPFKEIIRDLQNSDDFKDFKSAKLADTRIPHFTLYDHSVLTSGIAVAITKELLFMGKTPNQICCEDISDEDLLTFVRLVPLLHNVAKSKYEAVKGDFITISKEILLEHGFEEPLYSLIQDAIAHYRLQDYKTLFHNIIGLADALASTSDGPKVADGESFRVLYNRVFEGKKGLTIILGDTDRVHSYVLETSKLPEIRGASELLNMLNFEKLEKTFENELKLAKDCLIYNGGGSFLAVVPTSQSDSIIEKIEALYLNETGNATITCVKEEVDYLQFAQGMVPGANEAIKNLQAEGIGKWLIESHFGETPTFKKNGFGDIVAHLSVKIRWKKDMKEDIPLFEALPIGRRCSSCGRRVAVYHDEGKDMWLCNVCKIKRDKAGEPRLRFRMAFEDFLDSKGVTIENFHSKFPNDLEDLTKNYDKYYAFIYADGNEIGALLEEIKTPAHYRHFAEGLKEIVQKSVYDALFETFGEAKLKGLKLFPFEIINIGGDDVTIIIAKPFAFKFARLILAKFEDKTKEKLAKEFGKKELTMSLGMTICKSTYPVYFAEKIAESLLREAKKKAKEDKGILKSAVNYIYLTTSIASESGKDLLDMYYGIRRGDNEELILVMRPYTLDDFTFMLDTARALKKEQLLSTTQRNAFQQALSKGRGESFNFVFYQIARKDKDKRGKLMEIVKRELSPRFECNDCYLWRLKANVDGNEYSTPFFDLLELVDIGGEAIE